MAAPHPFRRERVERELVRETSRILLQELKDPRLGFVTVTKARVSDDYRYAKISVSVMGDEGKKKSTLAALRHAHGFLQRTLSDHIKLRSFPKVEFVLDESIEKSFRVLKMIDDLAEERRKRGADEGGAGKEEE